LPCIKGAIIPDREKCQERIPGGRSDKMNRQKALPLCDLYE
jgi:hypothetical protein